jgi:hypothetical protein
MKEPKYIITVKVESRRIAGDPLNTSLDTLLHWHSQGQERHEISARQALHILNSVRMTMRRIFSGVESVLSESQVTATDRLFHDVDEAESPAKPENSELKTDN